MDRDDSEYFSGRKLRGDDFNQDEIERWFEEEKEGYADLGAKDRSRYVYPYHAINQRHFFRHLPPGVRFRHLLSVGGAYGDEVRPLLPRVDSVTIVEPSRALAVREIEGVPVTYVVPRADGTMPFPSGAFDLLTCIGVLHHIPNVSHVLSEFARCLEPDAWALIREPTVSMGDWRGPRRGLTRWERGIPLPIFRTMLRTAGFEIRRETRCMFPPIRGLDVRIGRSAYNHPTLVWLDEMISKLFLWNRVYHPSGFWKLQPAAVYYVLRKPGSGR